MPMRKLSHMVADQLEVKELTVDEVSHATGVSADYIDAIKDSRGEKLPPLPYLKHDLYKLAEYLELDPALVLEAYKNEFSAKLSGQGDQLPYNRFALPSHKRRWLIGGISLLIFIGLLLISGRVFSRPYLELTVPDPNQNPYVVTEPTVVLIGRVDPSDKLFINDQSVLLDASGRFSYPYQLDPELNAVEFRVSRFLGKELVVVKQVYWQVQLNESTISSPTNPESVPMNE